MEKFRKSEKYPISNNYFSSGIHSRVQKFAWSTLKSHWQFMLQTWQIHVITLTKKDRLRRRQSLSNIGYKIDILHVQTAPNDKDTWSNIQLIWKLCLNFLMVNWAHIKLLKYSYSLNTQISISISPSWNFLIYDIWYVGIKLSDEKRWAIRQSLERWQHNTL